MQHYKVESMSCGHCISAITEALKDADQTADINVDLASKTVAVDSQLDPQAVVSLLDEAGFEDATPLKG